MCFYLIVMLCQLYSAIYCFHGPLMSVELQPQCPMSHVRVLGQNRYWTHIMEGTKKSIFLEIKHHLLKFKETEVGWQACGYLRRS